MDFYSSIAEQYDFIFPFNPVQKGFVEHSLSDPLGEKHVLDIGCGTGNLTIELSHLFKTVAGIDLDPAMIHAAKQKSGQPDFYCRNMLKISEDFSENTFDAVICFGNTLVHLDGTDRIGSFFSHVRKVLKPGGKFLLQIINYNRILDHQVDCLPTIENETIKFERLYHYQEKTHRISFDTRLTIKATGEMLENSVDLYPLVQNELKELLENNGFETVHLFGNFKKEVLTDNSIPLVIEAC